MTTPHDHPRDWWQRPGLEARGGRLLVAGRDAETLAREHGTPLFVYDLTHIEENVRALQGAHVLLDVREVVDEKRRAVLAGQRLGVASGDEQAAGPGLEARPLPPVARVVVRGGHVAPFRLAAPCAPPQSVSRRGHSAQAGCYSGFDGGADALH